MEQEPKTGLELSLKSQAILDIARIEALALNDAQIGPEHLMMAFLREGYVRQVFATFHVGEADFRQKLAGFSPHQSGCPQQEPTLGHNLQMLVEKAAFDAAVKGKPQIAPVHLLSATILDDGYTGGLIEMLVMKRQDLLDKLEKAYEKQASLEGLRRLTDLFSSPRLSRQQREALRTIIDEILNLFEQ